MISRPSWYPSASVRHRSTGSDFSFKTTRAEAAKRAAGSLFAPKLFSARTRQVVRWLLRLGG